MSTAYSYLVGTDVIVDTPSGTEIRRVDRLDGVWGDAYAQAVNVLSDANVPTLGTAHPAKGDAYLISRVVRALEPGRFDVELTYATRDKQWDPGGQLEVSAQLTGYTSQYTGEGDQIVTVSGDEVQVHQVERQMPLVVMRWKRVKSSLAEAVAELGAQGCVNALEWKGAPAYHALCVHAEVSKLYEGAWLQTFEFHVHPLSWRVAVTHEDWLTGKPIESPDAGERQEYQVYLSYDFNALGLVTQ
jgi:hypothetical protein